MITTNAVKTILDAQKHLVSLGGKILKEFKQINGVTSKLVEPGIIDVTDIKNLPDEEYFGPLLQIIRSNNFNHAIDIANDTKYGLVSEIITKNKDLFWKAESELKTGIVNWNRPTTGCASVVPFGGMGWSGCNRPSGYTTIEHCGHPTALHLTEVPELPSKLLQGLKNIKIKFMKFLNIIDDRFDELLNRLEMLSNINTHTYNLLGLDSCIYPLEKMFKELEPDESQTNRIKDAVPFVFDGEQKIKDTEEFFVCVNDKMQKQKFYCVGIMIPCIPKTTIFRR